MPVHHSVTPSMVAPSPVSRDAISLPISAPSRSNSMVNARSCPPPFMSDLRPRHVSLSKKAGAEFVGTFMIVFGAVSAPLVNDKYGNPEGLLGAAAAAGLAVMIVVLSTGHICGAHLNPAVTLAFAIFRHFPWSEVPAYIVAQALGSICASFALQQVFRPLKSGGVTVPSIDAADAFFLEFLVTFFLVFVITSVATDTRAVGELAGLAIGGTVALDVLVAGKSTGASMNPVRTLGPAIVTGNYDHIWVYILGPTAGAIAGAAVYAAVKLKDDQADERRQATAFRS